LTSAILFSIDLRSRIASFSSFVSSPNGLEMPHQADKGVADAVELFALTGDIGKNLGFDLWFGGGPEIDIDEADLAAHGIEEHRDCTCLGNVTGYRQFESGMQAPWWM
jgi:hypothetical protein